MSSNNKTNPPVIGVTSTAKATPASPPVWYSTDTEYTEYGGFGSYSEMKIELKRSNGNNHCSKCGVTIPKGLPFGNVRSTNWCHLCIKDVNDCIDVLLKNIPADVLEDFVSERFVNAL